jgi:hypothetical protein
MSLSRVKKYKKIKRKMAIPQFFSEYISKNMLKKFILSSTLVGTLSFISTVAYANMGISDYFKNWYLERLNDAENFLTSSIDTETTNQKANLLKQVREQTEKSVQELQEYAASKNSSINQNISKKAKETLDTIQAQNQSDVEIIKKQIDDQANSVQNEQ